MEDNIIEYKISNFVETQFPTLYRDEQTIFVEFVKQYYKWLESNNKTLYHSRRLIDYNDIDKTAEDFIIYFKETYLKDIQFQTQTNTRQLLKHTLDLYRSKGTARAIELLFKLVFGVNAEIYQPGKDIFRLSSGQYIKQKYLEINLHEEAHKLAGKVVTGQRSNASAYVESVVRKKIKGRLRDVLYISDVVGQFIYDEYLIIPNDIIISDRRFFIIGSLNRVSLPATGISSDYNIGDVIQLESSMGIGGLSIVSNTVTTTGTVNFTIVDGGFGFSETAEILISDKVLKLSNVVVDNAESKGYFEVFNEVIQPTANINIVNANGDFTDGESIYTYYANGDVKGEGIITKTYINEGEANGVISVAVLSGDLNEPNYYTTSNAISAELDLLEGYIDTSTSANVMGIANEVEIHYINKNSSNFQLEDIIYQVNDKNEVVANGTITLIENLIGANGTLTVSNTTGIFHGSRGLKVLNKSTTANVNSIDLRIGIINANNPFDTNSGNKIIANSAYYNTTASIISQSFGSGASFEIGSLIYPEVVSLNTDNLSDHLDEILGDQWLTFPTGNTYSNAIIGDVLTYQDKTIGRIFTIDNINPGSDYSAEPFILVYEPETYRYFKKDQIYHLSNATGDFATSEIVNQDSTGAKGILKEHGTYTYKGEETEYIRVQRLKFTDANNFQLSTANSETLLYGESSGTTAEISLIYDVENSKDIGINALFSGEVSISNGAINGLLVIDSGYGFKQGESVYIKNANSILGYGTGHLDKEGTAEGKYINEGGFLSHNKKLFDGIYYQEYSYEVRSSVVLNKYEDMLKKVLHVAGTKYFGALIYSENINIPTTINDTVITTEEQ